MSLELSSSYSVCIEGVCEGDTSDGDSRNDILADTYNRSSSTGSTRLDVLYDGKGSIVHMGDASPEPAVRLLSLNLVDSTS